MAHFLKRIWQHTLLSKVYKLIELFFSHVANLVYFSIVMLARKFYKVPAIVTNDCRVFTRMATVEILGITHVKRQCHAIDQRDSCIKTYKLFRYRERCLYDDDCTYGRPAFRYLHYIDSIHYVNTKVGRGHLSLELTIA